MKNLCFLCALVLMAGCFQVYNDDSDLRTVPVTNNPNIIPNHGSMMGLPAPY